MSATDTLDGPDAHRAAALGKQPLHHDRMPAAILVERPGFARRSSVIRRAAGRTCCPA